MNQSSSSTNCVKGERTGAVDDWLTTSSTFELCRTVAAPVDESELLPKLE